MSTSGINTQLLSLLSPTLQSSGLNAGAQSLPSFFGGPSFGQPLVQGGSFANNGFLSSFVGILTNMLQAKLQSALLGFLRNQMNPGINPPPEEAKQPIPAAGKEIPTGTDYTKLNTQQRTDLSGLSDRERAVLHLWGIQMTAKGFQDGGVLLNVNQGVGNPAGVGVNFTAAEKSLAQELSAKEQTEFGGVNGKELDKEFFKVYQKITGKDISQRYGNAQTHFATGVIDITNRAATNNGAGLTGYEKGILRLWGHNPLFSGGKVDGSILAYSLNSPTALDAGLDKRYEEGLIKADLGSDGVLNGDSLEGGFLDVLDKVYLGGSGASLTKTAQDAQTKAQKLGRSAQQVVRDATQGVQLAIDNVGQMMKDHPIVSIAGAGGLAAAAAVCPYLGGLGVATAGIAMAQQFLDGGLTPPAKIPANGAAGGGQQQQQPLGLLGSLFQSLGIN